MIKFPKQLQYISATLLFTLAVPPNALAAEKDKVREPDIKSRIAIFETAAAAASTEKKIIKKAAPLLPARKANDLPSAPVKEIVKFPPEELPHKLLEEIFGASTRLSSIEVAHYTVAVGDVANKVEYKGLWISHKLSPEGVTRYLSYLKEYPHAVAINEENMTRPTNTLGEEYDSYLVRYKLFAHSRNDAPQVDKDGFIVTVSKLKEKVQAMPPAPAAQPTNVKGDISSHLPTQLMPPVLAEQKGAKPQKPTKDLPLPPPLKSAPKEPTRELISRERSPSQPLSAPQEISYEVIKQILEAPFVMASTKPFVETSQSLSVTNVIPIPNLVAQKIDYRGLQISHKMTQAAPSRLLALLHQHPYSVAVKDDEHKRAVNTLGETYNSVMATYNLYTEAGENGKIIPHSEIIITISKKSETL